tara:strand:+ start:184 stop:471 length:288 start_codon:yes stop_codon:yes gene_type:complete
MVIFHAQAMVDIVGILGKYPWVIMFRAVLIYAHEMVRCVRNVEPEVVAGMNHQLVLINAIDSPMMMATLFARTVLSHDALRKRCDLEPPFCLLAR